MTTEIYDEFCKLSNNFTNKKIDFEGIAGIDDYYFWMKKLEFNKMENLIRFEYNINGNNSSIIEMIIAIEDGGKTVNVQCLSKLITHTWTLNFSRLVSDKLNNIAKKYEIDHTIYEPIDSTQFCHKYSVGFYKYGINDISALSSEIFINMLVGSSLMNFTEKLVFEKNWF